MKNPRNNHLLVGMFVLSMLGALLVWLVVLSGATQSTTPYYMEFQNVIGLAPGGQILYEGFPVGEIDKIEFVRRPGGAMYRLDVNIRDEWEIPEDSLAMMTQASLLSAVVVDIQSGTSQEILPAGSKIPSVGSTSILTTLSSVAGKINSFTETSLLPLLNDLSNSAEPLHTLYEDAPVILENVKTFTAQLTKATTRLNAILDRNGGRIDSILGNADEASGNISTLTTDFHRTRKQLDALLISTRTLISKNRGEIDHSIADLHHALEVVASHVQEISSNLEATTRNMNELSNELRRNPGLIVRDRQFIDP